MSEALPRSRMAPWRAALWSLMLLAGMAQAAGEPLGPAEQFTDGIIQVERAANGDYALLGVASGTGIYVRAYNADGTPRGPAQPVDPFLTGSGSYREAQLEMDDNGRLLVAWLDVGVIKGRHFAEDGTPMGPSKLLAPTTLGLLVESWDLAMAPDGSYALMTHTQTLSANGASAVMLYRFHADGRARLPLVLAVRAEIDPQLRVLGLPYYEYQRADLINRIAIDGQGNVVLATLFITQTSYKPGTVLLRSSTPSERYRGQLQLRRISPNGLPVGRVVTVSTYDTANRPIYMDPEIASAPDGSVAISWLQPDEGLKLWQFSPGLTPSAPGQVVSPTAVAVSPRDLDIADNGKAVIAWEEPREDIFDSEVHARVYGADGSLLGSVVESDTTGDGNHGAPSVGADAQGNFVMSWGSSFRKPGGGWTGYSSVRRYSGQ